VCVCIHNPNNLFPKKIQTFSTAIKDSLLHALSLLLSLFGSQTFHSSSRKNLFLPRIVRYLPLSRERKLVWMGGNSQEAITHSIKSVCCVRLQLVGSLPASSFVFIHSTTQNNPKRDILARSLGIVMYMSYHASSRRQRRRRRETREARGE
jgi:hypothetical protein